VAITEHYILLKRFDIVSGAVDDRERVLVEKWTTHLLRYFFRIAKYFFITKNTLFMVKEEH